MLRKAKSSKLVEWKVKSQRPLRRSGVQELYQGRASEPWGPAPATDTVANPSQNAGALERFPQGLLRQMRLPGLQAAQRLLKVTQQARQGWDHRP